MSTRVPSPEVTGPRARVAAYSRSRRPDDPEFVAAKRDLAAATLYEHVQRVLAKAPDLTPEQKTAIRALFA